MPTTQHYLTAVEVARALRVSRQSVTRWIQQGRLQAAKLGGGRTSPLRIPASELERARREGLR